jgi:hypothetical protein
MCHGAKLDMTVRIVAAGYDNEKSRSDNGRGAGGCGNPVDGVGEEHLHLVDLERLDRVVQTIGGRIAHHRLARSLSPGGQDLVEGDEADERDLRQRFRELPIAQAELTGELVVVGRAPQLVLELRVRRAPSRVPTVAPSRTTGARR